VDVDVDVDGAGATPPSATSPTADAEAAAALEDEAAAAAGESRCVHAADIADHSAATESTALGDGRRARLKCRGA
jgi:hypothetical protein